jgi:hypothetical protein
LGLTLFVQHIYYFLHWVTQEPFKSTSQYVIGSESLPNCQGKHRPPGTWRLAGACVHLSKFPSVGAAFWRPEIPTHTVPPPRAWGSSLWRTSYHWSIGGLNALYSGAQPRFCCPVAS